MKDDLDFRGLKAVTRVAVKEAGGQENCAAISKRIQRPAAFSDYANPEIPERVIPLDVAIELDRFNKNGRLIRFAARMLGYLMVPMPRLKRAATTAEALAKVVKESSEAMASIAPFIDQAHMKPSQTQRAYAIKQIDEMIEAGLEMRAMLEPPASDEEGE